MFKKSSNAQTTYGLRQSQNLTDLQLWQMSKMSESEERLYLQAVQQQAEHHPMAPKSITSPASALKNPQPYETLWSEDTPSSLGMESALPMFSKECSGLQSFPPQGSILWLPTGRPSKRGSTRGYQDEVPINWNYSALGKTSTKLTQPRRSTFALTTSPKTNDRSEKFKNLLVVLLAVSAPLLLWVGLMGSAFLNLLPNAWLTAGGVLMGGLFLIGQHLRNRTPEQ